MNTISEQMIIKNQLMVNNIKKYIETELKKSQF